MKISHIRENLSEFVCYLRLADATFASASDFLKVEPCIMSVVVCLKKRGHDVEFC